MFLLINLSHQVGLVAHSARLNVYGPPSSRGLHNVTAVSRFRPLSVKSCLRNVELFSRGRQLLKFSLGPTLLQLLN